MRVSSGRVIVFLRYSYHLSESSILGCNVLVHVHGLCYMDLLPFKFYQGVAITSIYCQVLPWHLFVRVMEEPCTLKRTLQLQILYVHLLPADGVETVLLHCNITSGLRWQTFMSLSACGICLCSIFTLLESFTGYVFFSLPVDWIVLSGLLKKTFTAHTHFSLNCCNSIFVSYNQLSIVPNKRWDFLLQFSPFDCQNQPICDEVTSVLRMKFRWFFHILDSTSFGRWYAPRRYQSVVSYSYLFLSPTALANVLWYYSLGPEWWFMLMAGFEITSSVITEVILSVVPFCWLWL